MKQKKSEKATGKNNFYFKVFNALKTTTNLSKIRKELNISKENLNYYLRELKEKGYIIKKARGWYEVPKNSEKLTKYGNLLPKDFIRGHAFVFNVKIPKKIKNWDKRIEILKKSNIHYILVGAKLTTPRIKALGRKIWLCNDHLRIFDIKKKSYYGENAIESRKLVFRELLNIIQTIENKLKINLKPFDFNYKKEHYALIKNDLAIDQNKKGIIWRIRDEQGEWLLVDDSLGEGGELENVGKDSFKTNLPMQKWWNNQKQTGFQVTPEFILESFNKTNQNILQVTQNQVLFDKNFQSHLKVLNKLGKAVDNLTQAVQKKNIKEKITDNQKTLSDF